jgi:UTP--glucose-1-phosphate uridylyltransferase
MPEFQKITTAVIAAAGQASRMWPASKVFPKELFPLGKIPVIVHIVWEFMDAGIENIVIVAAAHNREYVAALFDPSIPPLPKLLNDPLVRRFQESLGRCSLSIIEQSGAYGNGTPLIDAAKTFGRVPCVYAFGDDVIIGENATRALIGVYERTGNPVLGVQEVSPARKSSFGIVECRPRDGVDYVQRLFEKPKPADTPSNLASFGRYVITPPVLEKLTCTRAGKDGEIWLIDAISGHLASGSEVCVAGLTAGTWYTVGDPAGYAAAVNAATEEQLAPRP